MGNPAGAYRDILRTAREFLGDEDHIAKGIDDLVELILSSVITSTDAIDMILDRGYQIYSERWHIYTNTISLPGAETHLRRDEAGQWSGTIVGIPSEEIKSLIPLVVDQACLRGFEALFTIPEDPHE